MTDVCVIAYKDTPTCMIGPVETRFAYRDLGPQRSFVGTARRRSCRPRKSQHSRARPLDPVVPNSDDWRVAEIPSANGFAAAEELARLYRAFIGGQIAATAYLRLKAGEYPTRRNSPRGVRARSCLSKTLLAVAH